MHIYKAEKEAGIDFQTNKSGSSAALITSKAQVCNLDKYVGDICIDSLLSSKSTINNIEELIGQDQPDLALVVSILVSTGWNDNDDFFAPAEVWKAKTTPIHKPMNDGHKANKILGHIVKSRVLDKDGNEIDSSAPEISVDEFDIEVAGVLYRAFPEISDRIEEIISKANTGEMFVSMEAWFPDFAYAVLDEKTGQTKFIERTEATAFLTKHLRAYGGSGNYQNYKLGRVLKNIIFGGLGFTDQPANPESVIKVAATKKLTTEEFVGAELSEITEGGVEEMDENQVKELQTQLEAVKADLKVKEQEVSDLQSEAKEAKEKDYEGKISTLEADIETLKKTGAEADEKIKALESSNSDLQTKLDEATVRADKSEAELTEIQKKEMAKSRLAKLTEVKSIEDEESTLAELKEMSEETFAVVLKYAGQKVSDETDEKEIDKSKSEEQELNQAEAALDNAEEDGSDPDFNADGAKETEADKWLGMAIAMCDKNPEDV